MDGKQTWGQDKLEEWRYPVIDETSESLIVPFQQPGNRPFAPTRRMITVAHPANFRPKMELKIETEHGYQFRHVHRKDGNVLMLVSALDADPLMGGKVYHCTDYRFDYIDRQATERLEKEQKEAGAI